MRKGLSPVISVVLLIAFSIAVAGIVGNWIITHEKETTQSIDKDREKLDCLNADLRFTEDDIIYDSDALNVTIENKGKTGLYDFSAFYIKDVDVIEANITSGQRNESNPLGQGELERLKTEGNTTGILELRIVPSNCPDSFYELEV